MFKNFDQTQTIRSFWETLEYESPTSSFTKTYCLSAITGMFEDHSAYLVEDIQGNGMDIYLKPNTEEHAGYAYVFSKDTSTGFIKMREDLPLTGEVLVCDDLEACAALSSLTGRQVLCSLFSENTRAVCLDVVKAHPDVRVLAFEADILNLERTGYAIVAFPKSMSLVEKIKSNREQVLTKIQEALAELTEQQKVRTGSTTNNRAVNSTAISAEGLVYKTRNTIQASISIDESSAMILAMYAFFTYLINSFVHAPILCISSPVKRCGKSTLLQVCNALFWNVTNVKGITKASLEAIADSKCTTVIDEFDEVLKNNPGVIGAINGGIEAGAKVTLVGKDGLVKTRSTYGAKVLALIGLPAPTIYDRSILVRMRRKKTGEKLSKPEHLQPTLAYLKRQIEQWCKENATHINRMKVAPLEVENDRFRDNYEPLLKIAACISSRLESEVRRAADFVVTSQLEEDSGGEKLLKDIKTVFDDTKKHEIGTNELLLLLCEHEDSVWRRCDRNMSISPTFLSRSLGAFGISPVQIRPGKATQVRGYKHEQFKDAFERYAPDKKVSDKQ